MWENILQKDSILNLLTNFLLALMESIMNNDKSSSLRKQHHSWFWLHLGEFSKIRADKSSKAQLSHSVTHKLSFPIFQYYVMQWIKPLQYAALQFIYSIYWISQKKKKKNCFHVNTAFPPISRIQFPPTCFKQFFLKGSYQKITHLSAWQQHWSHSRSSLGHKNGTISIYVKSHLNITRY